MKHLGRIKMIEDRIDALIEKYMKCIDVRKGEKQHGIKRNN